METTKVEAQAVQAAASANQQGQQAGEGSFIDFFKAVLGGASVNITEGITDLAFTMSQIDTNIEASQEETAEFVEEETVELANEEKAEEEVLEEAAAVTKENDVVLKEASIAENKEIAKISDSQTEQIVNTVEEVEVAPVEEAVVWQNNSSPVRQTVDLSATEIQPEVVAEDSNIADPKLSLKDFVAKPSSSNNDKNEASTKSEDNNQEQQNLLDTFFEPISVAKGQASSQVSSPSQQNNNLVAGALGALGVTNISDNAASGVTSKSSSVSVIGGAGSATDKATSAKKVATTTIPGSKQDEIIQKIKDLIKNANNNQNPNGITFRLDPANLGAITVRLTQKADQVFARVIPESPEVEAMLKTRIGELTQVLSSTGVRSENIHVNIGHETAEADFFKFAQFGSSAGSNTESDNSGREGREAHLEQKNNQNNLARELGAKEQVAKPSNINNGVVDSGWVA